MSAAQALNSFVVALVAALALPSVARADEPKVEVKADVILASNQGNVVEPPSLSAVKDEFASAGIVFSSYRRLSSERLALVGGRPVVLKLPNAKTATFQLEQLKAGTATVKVKGVGAEVTIQLGREGSVFQRVGAHQGGQLILMLSAAQPGKPRRAPALLHRASPLQRAPAGG